MADTKISALSAAAALAGTEPAPVVQAGATVKATVADIAALSGITALTGDATTPAGSTGSKALTLATVNANVGSFTTSSITVNAKGLVTAASSGTAAVAPHPGFAASRYYSRRASQALSTGAAVTNKIYAVPFLVPTSTTFTKMCVYVTLGSALSNVELAIYANSAGAPGAIEYDAGTVATTTNATKAEITGLSLILSAGWHWLACGFGGTPTLRANTGGDNLMDLLGIADPSGTAPITGVQAAWTYSANNAPATFSAGGSFTLLTAACPMAFVSL